MQLFKNLLQGYRNRCENEALRTTKMLPFDIVAPTILNENENKVKLDPTLSPTYSVHTRPICCVHATMLDKDGVKY